MIYATIIILYLASLLWSAYAEADIDAKNIAAGVPINHGNELAERIFNAGCIWAMGGMVMFMFTNNAWLSLPMAPMGWAWWTMNFRLRLNSKRRKDWRYVSKSNWYDWQFIKRTPAGITRAGTIAYIFEALVFALSATVFVALS